MSKYFCIGRASVSRSTFLPNGTTRSKREEARGHDAMTLRGRRSGREEPIWKSEEGRERNEVSIQ